MLILYVFAIVKSFPRTVLYIWAHWLLFVPAKFKITLIQLKCFLKAQIHRQWLVLIFMKTNGSDIFSGYVKIDLFWERNSITLFIHFTIWTSKPVHRLRRDFPENRFYWIISKRLQFPAYDNICSSVRQLSINLS